MPIDRRSQHNHQLRRVSAELAGNTEPLKVKKKTVSNLFRYEGRNPTSRRQVDLSSFNQPLYLDSTAHTLDVQGLTTFEAIVDFTLPHGFVPVITPELKHITIGGATVGVGIETNSFRYGFVHDSLIEADVLLADGNVVLTRPDNQYRDLFYALANSYGTLGYVLRARIKLHKTKPYVSLRTQKYTTITSLIKAMEAASHDPSVDYIESLAYSKKELYLTIEKQVATPTKLSNVYGKIPFYKMISKAGQFDLPIRDYLFRYDPEWFWALGDSRFYEWFRRLAPRGFRTSSFYSRLEKIIAKFHRYIPQLKLVDEQLEPLIQDWEVPWEKAESLLDYALTNLNLEGKPLMSAPVMTTAKTSLYPMPPHKRYYNLGSYSLVRKKPGQPAYHSTRLMDEFCFKHGGLKMLYSTTFLTQDRFDTLYSGKDYQKLKQTYDPHGLLPQLYDKAVRSL